MGRKGYLNRGTKLAYVLKDKIKNVLIKHTFCPPLLTVKWKGTKTSTATEAANLTSNGQKSIHGLNATKKEKNLMFCKYYIKWSDSIPKIRTSFVVGNSNNIRIQTIKHHAKSKDHNTCTAKEKKENSSQLRSTPDRF